MIACMYDPACYFNDVDFHQKYDVLVNIQAFVENPIFIFSQSILLITSNFFTPNKSWMMS